jgi:transcriptional regulator with XRE-family HTH domain
MEFQLSPRLCKAARQLVGWSQQAIAKASGVPLPTISAFEAKKEDGQLTTMNNRALVQALEAAGVQFIPENGGGAGVRMKEPGRFDSARFDTDTWG